jgi:3-(3-hydroxy-phenyl)propionate hydroxylase
MSVDTAVVVVGAGPVGLVAALGFAAHGVDCVVFEAGPRELRPEWRGSTLHPPTLEILDRIGLADRAVQGGVRVDALQYRDLVLDHVVTINLTVLEGRTTYPFRLQYEQYKLLRQLRDAAGTSAHVAIHYEHEVVGVEPGDDATAARVTVERPDGTRHRVSARWVVAADGSHSTIRRALGVTMTGDTHPMSSLVVASDLAFDEAVPGLGPVSYWSGPGGRLSLIRTPDTWRVALTISRLVVGDDVVHPDFLGAMALLVGVRDWTDLRQHQTYRSHQRVADTFQVGRVVLAGDAAHLTATTGGMGLNAGVHDAHELVGAIAPAIVGGTDDHAAAAAAAASRQRIALELVQPATRAARLSADVTDEQTRKKRLDELQAIADDPIRLTDFVTTASMLDAVDLRTIHHRSRDLAARAPARPT